jgi:formylglycine-generating enzyme required for sulfatase activity
MQAVTGASVGSEGQINEATSAFYTAAANPVVVGNFLISQFETTVDFYNAVKNWAANPSYSYTRGGENYSFSDQVYNSGKQPAGVSARDTIIFLNALSEMTGLQPVYTSSGLVTRTASGLTSVDSYTLNQTANGYRLPTSAEWEFVGRGGYSAGSPSDRWAYQWAGTDSYSPIPQLDALKNYAQYNGGAPADVGSKYSNGLGLFDMSGNAWELLSDAYSSTALYTAGGGSANNATSVKLVARTQMSFSTTSSLANCGFRFVRNN